MQARYISPLTDFGFKKLFGEEANKNLLISFLNDLLPIKDKIVEINFKKNQQMGRDIESRSAVYDIFCEDEKNNQFIVEMQNARQTYFTDRAVFYSTFPIQEQAEKGKWDFNLKAVYCVGLLGFNLADKSQKEEKIISEYMHEVNLKDQNNKVFYEKLTYIYIELPKFTKKEIEIETHFEKWIYFLKNLENFEEIPNILKEKVFEEAFKVAEIAKYTPETRREYESSLKAYRDNINVIETARIEGEARGKVEGRVEGEAIKAVAIAENMLKDGLPEDTIVKYTGLSVNEIRELKNKNN